MMKSLDIIIPKCECGADRVFEFQLMPNVLNEIGNVLVKLFFHARKRN